MVERSQNSYPLLRQFREFYAEVARLRAIVEHAGSAGEWSPRTAGSAEVTSGESQSFLEPGAAQASAASTALVDKPGDTSAFGRNLDATTVRVWHDMAAYLDQKMYEVRLATSALSHDYLEELVYIMAAFSDETFVCLLEWPGKDYWRDHLMELRLFHTQIAGQDIFRRIEKALVRQDYGVEELAIIYLMVLALGLQGAIPARPGNRRVIPQEAIRSAGDDQPRSAAREPAAISRGVPPYGDRRGASSPGGAENLVANSRGNSRILVAPFHDRLVAAHQYDPPRTVGHHEVAGSSCQSRDSYRAHR